MLNQARQSAGIKQKITGILDLQTCSIFRYWLAYAN